MNVSFLRFVGIIQLKEVVQTILPTPHIYIQYIHTHTHTRTHTYTHIPVVESFYL